MSASTILLALTVLILYFIPTIIAVKRDHNNAASIVVCNLLGFIYGVPWLIALVWSCTDNVKDLK